MDALIIVDVQNDFLPGGALAVTDGDAVISVINQLAEQFSIVVATQDWHPPNHGSFASQHSGRRFGDVIDLHGLPQVLWPDHCVQNSAGAALATELNQSRIARIFPKGTDVEIDSYSGFFDNGHRKDTGLADFLKQQSVDRVFVTGLATDYCVKFTALDAVALGFRTCLVQDACRGVELSPGDVAAAIDAMQQAGVQVVTSEQLQTDQSFDNQSLL